MKSIALHLLFVPLVALANVDSADFPTISLEQKWRRHIDPTAR